MRTIALLVLTLIEIQAAVNEPIQNVKPQQIRPTFIVNLDTAVVICQHSVNNKDLHMHDLSILCDSTLDCFGDDQSMNDENFPYCASSCGLGCSKHGACLLNGTTPHCYCNVGFYGTSCQSYNPDLNAHADAKSRSFGANARSRSNAFSQIKTASKHRQLDLDKQVANDAFEESSNLEKSDQQQLKKWSKINRQKQSGGYILLHGPSDSEPNSTTIKVFDRTGMTDGKAGLGFCGSSGDETSRGCPENSKCVEGRCECLVGFNWNTKAEKCEAGRFDLSGSHFEPASSRRRLQTTAYGDWKNYTGGQLIISRGKVLLPNAKEWGLELTGGSQAPQIEPKNERSRQPSNKFSNRTFVSHQYGTLSPSTLHNHSNRLVRIEEINLPPNKDSSHTYKKTISTPRKIAPEDESSSSTYKTVEASGVYNSNKKEGFVSLIRGSTTSQFESTTSVPLVIDEFEASTQSNTNAVDQIQPVSSTRTEDEWIIQLGTTKEPFTEPKDDVDTTETLKSTESTTERNSILLLTHPTTQNYGDDWMVNPGDLSVPDSSSTTAEEEDSSSTESTLLPTNKEALTTLQGLEHMVTSGEKSFEPTSTINNVSTLFTLSPKRGESQIKINDEALTKSSTLAPTTTEITPLEQGLEIVAISREKTNEMTTEGNHATPNPLEQGLEIVAMSGEKTTEYVTKSTPAVVTNDFRTTIEVPIKIISEFDVSTNTKLEESTSTIPASTTSDSTIFKQTPEDSKEEGLTIKTLTGTTIDVQTTFKPEASTSNIEETTLPEQGLEIVAKPEERHVEPGREPFLTDKGQPSVSSTLEPFRTPRTYSSTSKQDEDTVLASELSTESTKSISAPSKIPSTNKIGGTIPVISRNSEADTKYTKSPKQSKNEITASNSTLELDVIETTVTPNIERLVKEGSATLAPSNTNETDTKSSGRPIKTSLATQKIGDKEEPTSHTSHTPPKHLSSRHDVSFKSTLLPIQLSDKLNRIDKIEKITLVPTTKSFDHTGDKMPIQQTMNPDVEVKESKATKLLEIVTSHVESTSQTNMMTKSFKTEASSIPKTTTIQTGSSTESITSSSHIKNVKTTTQSELTSSTPKTHHHKGSVTEKSTHPSTTLKTNHGEDMIMNEIKAKTPSDNSTTSSGSTSSDNGIKLVSSTTVTLKPEFNAKSEPQTGVSPVSSLTEISEPSKFTALPTTSAGQFNTRLGSTKEALDITSTQRKEEVSGRESFRPSSKKSTLASRDQFTSAPFSTRTYTTNTPDKNGIESNSVVFSTRFDEHTTTPTSKRTTTSTPEFTQKSGNEGKLTSSYPPQQETTTKALNYKVTSRPSLTSLPNSPSSKSTPVYKENGFEGSSNFHPSATSNNKRERMEVELVSTPNQKKLSEGKTPAVKHAEVEKVLQQSHSTTRSPANLNEAEFEVMSPRGNWSSSTSTSSPRSTPKPKNGGYSTTKHTLISNEVTTSQASENASSTFFEYNNKTKKIEDPWQIKEELLLPTTLLPTTSRSLNKVEERQISTSLPAFKVSSSETTHTPNKNLSTMRSTQPPHVSTIEASWIIKDDKTGVGASSNTQNTVSTHFSTPNPRNITLKVENDGSDSSTRRSSENRIDVTHIDGSSASLLDSTYSSTSTVSETSRKMTTIMLTTKSILLDLQPSSKSIEYKVTSSSRAKGITSKPSTLLQNIVLSQSSTSNPSTTPPLQGSHFKLTEQSSSKMPIQQASIESSSKFTTMKSTTTRTLPTLRRGSTAQSRILVEDTTLPSDISIEEHVHTDFYSTTIESSSTAETEEMETLDAITTMTATKANHHFIKTPNVGDSLYTDFSIESTTRPGPERFSTTRGRVDVWPDATDRPLTSSSTGQSPPPHPTSNPSKNEFGLIITRTFERPGFETGNGNHLVREENLMNEEKNHPTNIQDSSTPERDNANVSDFKAGTGTEGPGGSTQTSSQSTNTEGLLLSGQQATPFPGVRVDDAGVETKHSNENRQIDGHGKSSSHSASSKLKTDVFIVRGKGKQEKKNDDDLLVHTTPEPSPSNPSHPSNENPPKKKQSTSSGEFVSVGKNIPEADGSENPDLPPSRTVHLIKNVQRFQNGTLKYWSTLVPVQKTSFTEQTPSGFRTDTAEAQTTLSVGLEISGDDANPPQKVTTKEYGLEIRGEGPYTSTSPSRPNGLEIITEDTDNKEIDRLDKIPTTALGDTSKKPDKVFTLKTTSTTPQPDELSKKHGDFTPPPIELIPTTESVDELSAGENEHGLIIENTGNGWPNKVETTQIVKEKSTPSFKKRPATKAPEIIEAKGSDPNKLMSSSTTQFPKIEIVTESSFTVQQPDELIVATKNTPPSEETSTSLDKIITAKPFDESRTTSEQSEPTSTPKMMVEIISTSKRPEEIQTVATTEPRATTAIAEVHTDTQRTSPLPEQIKTSPFNIPTTFKLPEDQTTAFTRASTLSEDRTTSTTLKPLIIESSQAPTEKEPIQSSSTPIYSISSSTPTPKETSGSTTSVKVPLTEGRGPSTLQASTVQGSTQAERDLNTNPTASSPTGNSKSTYSPVPDDNFTNEITTRQPTLSTIQTVRSTLTPKEAPTEKGITPPRPTQTVQNEPYCVSNDECGIDAFCQKPNGVCLCKKGFIGVPSKCMDIDECKTRTDRCHPSSLCQNHVGGFSCQCPIGYRMTNNGVCIDINECTERNTTLCSPDASCLNKPGSYECECKDGFVGDGFSCYFDQKRLCNPAEQEISGCHRNHLCLVDLEGKLDCDKCKHGYAMHRGVCLDINECSILSTNECHEHGVCVNVPGSYYCQCRNGFKGDGVNCEDIDECQNNPCHPQAKCTNLVGNFSCTCPNGWKGDGLNSCINPLERMCEEKSKICTSEDNSACLSTEVRKEMATFCECSEGFRWNPKTKQCDDVDECLERRHTCNTTTSFCANTLGSYACHCLNGFEGKHGICVDIDECHRHTHNCSQNAYCVNRIGDYSCVCADGYTGDGRLCILIEEEDEAATCTDNWIQYCRSLNKTCFVDEEEILQCGSCLGGYHPIDGKCLPLNAAGNCADPAKNNCDTNANCIDVHSGSHLCVCRDGFIGDGLHCDDVDECTMPGVCDQNSVCQNIPGSFKCHCHPGFLWDGHKCEPVAEQRAEKSCLRDKSLCHSNAECTYDGSCRCVSGYVGDGVLVCTQMPRAPPSSDQTYISKMAPGFEKNTTPPRALQQFVKTEQITTSTASTTSRRIVTTPKHRITIRTTVPYIRYYTPSPQNITGNVVGYQKQDLCKTLSSKCHQFATCQPALNTCVCNQNYIGDGFTSCIRMWEDCGTNKTMCDENAECSGAQCRCKLGFIGDGISCIPDRLNCQIQRGLCSEFASCVGQRCVCNAGYTGDGQMCFSLETKTNRFDCLACHCRATCINKECWCERGFLGNGLACVPDPYDCVYYPGVCHMNGHCNNGTRRCECNINHIGNGYDCVLRRSCLTNPRICHQDAECLSCGQCRCKPGFFGDGYDCKNNLLSAKAALKLSPSGCPRVCPQNSECLNGACKCLAGFVLNPNDFCVDVDECRTGASACHFSARCLNTEGSYECKCPGGMIGDGRNCYYNEEIRPELKIQCDAGGIKIILAEEGRPFAGRIFVDGQRENPHCSKAFDAQQTYLTQQQSCAFYVPAARCNMNRENYNTLSTTVVVQKHDSTRPYSYQVRCTYPLGTKFVGSEIGVSEAENIEGPVYIGGQKSGPTCNFSVTNLENVVVNSSVVGQVLKLALSVQPSDSYGIMPKNCFAINLETADRYRLTDENGCASDTDLFPQWTHPSPSLTQSIFRVFKWPDSRMIRFECECSPCLNGCQEVDCSKQHAYRVKRHLMKSNRLERGESNATGPSYQEEWIPRRTAFSSVIYVHERQENEDVQQEFEDWLARKELRREHYTAQKISSSFGRTWQLMIIFVGVFLLAFVLILFLFRRVLQVKKTDQKKIQHANSLGNLSSYIQF